MLLTLLATYMNTQKQTNNAKHTTKNAQCYATTTTTLSRPIQFSLAKVYSNTKHIRTRNPYPCQMNAHFVTDYGTTTTTTANSLSYLILFIVTLLHHRVRMCVCVCIDLMHLMYLPHFLSPLRLTLSWRSVSSVSIKRGV